MACVVVGVLLSESTIALVLALVSATLPTCSRRRESSPYRVRVVVGFGWWGGGVRVVVGFGWWGGGVRVVGYAVIMRRETLTACPFAP